MPRQLVRIVSRSEEPRPLWKVLLDLALVPDVVAAGQHVEPEGKEFLGHQGGDAEAARRVLNVRNREMDVFFGHNSRQMSGHNAPPGGGENISYEQDVHGFPG